jgi:hypothetical protein
MTFPRLAALNRRWAEVPPAAINLARIARYLGAAPSSASKPQDPIAQARKAGIPFIEGHLPDDPLLGFLDDRIGLGMSLH